MNKLPFIFARLTKESQLKVKRGGLATIRDWVVVIASHDLSHYDSAWMCCQELGDACLIPTVDLLYAEYEFSTYVEARAFVKQWWATKAA